MRRRPCVITPFSPQRHRLHTAMTRRRWVTRRIPVTGKTSYHLPASGRATAKCFPAVRPSRARGLQGSARPSALDAASLPAPHLVQERRIAPLRSQSCRSLLPAAVGVGRRRGVGIPYSIPLRYLLPAAGGVDMFSQNFTGCASRHERPLVAPSGRRGTPCPSVLQTRCRVLRYRPPFWRGRPRWTVLVIVHSLTRLPRRSASRLARSDRFSSARSRRGMAFCRARPFRRVASLICPGSATTRLAARLRPTAPVLGDRSSQTGSPTTDEGMVRSPPSAVRRWLRRPCHGLCTVRRRL